MGIRIIYVNDEGEELVHDIQSPGHKQATNNQMELKACVIALEEAIQRKLTHGKTRIIVRTDSQYITENYKKAMFEWPNSRWFRRGGAPVQNAEIWKRLRKAIKKSNLHVDFEWVKGHSKDEHNRAVDRMARQSARMAVEPPLALSHVRRKLTDESVQIGSVKMEGQRVSIRIITTKWMPVQKLWQCKYEVITKSSKYYPNVDIAYSDEVLKPGHSYYVLFNSEPENPRVAKVFREIKND